jgi:hypothetical protein
MKKKLVCPTCGDEKDIIIRYEHVGGRGDAVPVPGCGNQVECWRRYDAQQARKEETAEVKCTPAARSAQGMTALSR